MEGVCMQIQAINNNLEFGKSKARKAREAAIRQQEDMALQFSENLLGDHQKGGGGGGRGGHPGNRTLRSTQLKHRLEKAA